MTSLTFTDVYDNLRDFEGQFRKGIRLGPDDFLYVYPTRYSEHYVQYENGIPQAKISRQEVYDAVFSMKQTAKSFPYGLDTHRVLFTVDGTGKPNQISMMIEFAPWTTEVYPKVKQLVENYNTHLFHLGYIPNFNNYIKDTYKKNPHTFLYPGRVVSMENFKLSKRMVVCIPICKKLPEPAKTFQELALEDSESDTVIPRRLPPRGLEL